MMYGKRWTALRPEGSIFLRVLSASAHTSRLSSLRKLSANARLTSDKTIWFPNLPSLARQSSTWLSNIQILKRVLLSPFFKNLIISRAQRCHKLLSEVAVKEIDANSRKVRPCKAGIPFTYRSVHVHFTSLEKRNASARPKRHKKGNPCRMVCKPDSQKSKGNKSRLMFGDATWTTHKSLQLTRD